MRRQPRFTRSINAKVKQTDYEKMVLLAGDRTVTSWARDVLVKALNGPDQFQVALMEQLWSLRFIVINGLPELAPDSAAAAKMLRALIDEAEDRKADKARTILVRR